MHQDVDFQDVYASLSEGNQVEENDYIYVVVDRFSKMCISCHVRKALLLKIILNMYGFILVCQLLFLVTRIPGSLGIFGPIFGR